MHERKKLEEAEYFYHHLVDEQTKKNREAFRHDLSAFLTAARSVLQYTDKEAKTKLGGSAWYNNQITSGPLLKFFRDERNDDIHEEPVATIAQNDISFSASVAFSAIAILLGL
jgi:hypothetical protein